MEPLNPMRPLELTAPLVPQIPLGAKGPAGKIVLRSGKVGLLSHQILDQIHTDKMREKNGI